MGVPRDQQLRNAQRRFGGTLGELGRGHEEQRSDVGRDFGGFFRFEKRRKKTPKGEKVKVK